jgi:uncharacterized protein (TIGR02646 family)
VIKIRKGAAPPGLVEAGEDHVRQLCAAYDTDPGLYQDGTRKMAFSSTIYASEAVKAALNASHHGKCCYCETVIQYPYAYPHVEHWRPKERSLQGRHEAPMQPGYYWLAYTWDNLLLSCAFCNSTKKGDLFPLQNPAARARHHGMRIEDETPAILKPDGDRDPREHITFHEEVPVGLTPLGDKTIEVLGLDSQAHEPRLTHLREIQRKREMYIDLMGIDHPAVRRCAELLRQSVEQAVQPEMPYSAMVAVYLEAHPLPDRPG